MSKQLKIGISLSAFDALGNLTSLLLKNGYTVIAHEQNLRNAEEIARFFNDCDVLIAGSEPLHKLVERSENLKLLLRAGVGTDNFSTSLCQSKGITWITTENQVSESVSNYVLANILSITSGIHQNRIMQTSDWRNKMSKGVSETTVGIVGLGRIGFSLLNRILHFPFKKFLLHDLAELKLEKNFDTRQLSRIRQVDLSTCLSDSDIVTLHVPLNAETKNLINKSNLALMAHDSWLINSSRGGVVNEKDLHRFLKEGRLGGAVLDVFEDEPYSGPLTNISNVILTPHIATYNLQTRIQMETFLVSKALEFIAKFNHIDVEVF